MRERSRRASASRSACSHREHLQRPARERIANDVEPLVRHVEPDLVLPCGAGRRRRRSELGAIADDDVAARPGSGRRHPRRARSRPRRRPGAGGAADPSRHLCERRADDDGRRRGVGDLPRAKARDPSPRERVAESTAELEGAVTTPSKPIQSRSSRPRSPPICTRPWNAMPASAPPSISRGGGTSSRDTRREPRGTLARSVVAASASCR